MSESRITRPRIIFAETLNSFGQISFSELKKLLVGKWEGKMDTTTLYRVIELFKKQWLLHEIMIDGERVLFLCKAKNSTTHDAVIITFCENCGRIYDEHIPLAQGVSSQYTEIRTKMCKNCMIMS